MYLLTQRGGTTAARIIVMIDKYRLEDMRRESGEKGELARWVIQLQADLDREIRKSASERAMLSRLAVIMHGSETDLNLLTVTAQSLMDRCKAGNSPVTPDGWIPVSDRMPERDVDVQVYCADKKEQMVGYMERNEADGWFRFASLPNGGGVYCKPTHWMPLPAAPQQEVM
ncbi:DUF551 domain-containing protein [Citrobacter freundii]|nr:DUF551 domain-containing protein [Citrobacter freundii]QMM94652.1 DUF551 domain-containing protein [Citrobacter freundii]